MKALALSEIGKLLDQIDTSTPAEKLGHSIVHLSAAALNHRDLWITKGMYPGIKKGVILGSDGAGVIGSREVIINPGINWGEHEAVQSDEFHVLGMPWNGTFAEYISIPDKYVYEKPAHLDMVEAAALPLAGVTAYRVLMTRCRLQPSDRVLITGTGGGVALMAAQFALALGCEVCVTSGSDLKIEKAIALGAKEGYNYKNPDWCKNTNGGFDVIIDSAGGPDFQNLIKICNPGARIGFYGATLGKYDKLNPQLMFWRQVSLLGSTMGSDADFKEMLEFVSKYSVHPVVDEVFPFEDQKSAFDKMEKGSQFGKLVLRI